MKRVPYSDCVPVQATPKCHTVKGALVISCAHEWTEAMKYDTLIGNKTIQYKSLNEHTEARNYDATTRYSDSCNLKMKHLQFKYKS